jgi:hypothetical protein
MMIRIDRDRPGQTQADGRVFFKAMQDGTKPIVVELDQTAWDTIRSDWPHDPLSGVEELAKQGHWSIFDERPVWRIDFV